MLKETDTKIEDGVYLRKGKLGHRIIYPIKNEDGSFNWFNMFTGGSWGNLLKILAVVAILLLLVWAYKNDVSTLVECCSNNNMMLNLGNNVGGLDMLKDINITGFT